MTKARKPARIPVADAVKALVDAGAPIGSVVIDVVNHRVFASGIESTQPLTKTGAKREWPTNIEKRI